MSFVPQIILENAQKLIESTLARLVVVALPLLLPVCNVASSQWRLSVAAAAAATICNGSGLRVVGLSVLVALARLPSSRLSCSSRCFAFYTHTNTHTHTHTGTPSQSDVCIRNADAVGACQAHNVNKDMRSAQRWQQQQQQHLHFPNWRSDAMHAMQLPTRR